MEPRVHASAAAMDAIQGILTCTVIVTQRLSGKEQTDHIAAELDETLDSYAKSFEKKKKVVNEEEERQFLERFERTQIDIIRPEMEAIGKYLEKKGHAYQIKDEVSISNDNPSIRMEIYPRTTIDSPTQEHEFPTITFIGAPDVEEIGIEVKDGMPGKPGLTRGHIAELESLTKDYVRDQIIFVIKRNFAQVAT